MSLSLWNRRWFTVRMLRYDQSQSDSSQRFVVDVSRSGWFNPNSWDDAKVLRRGSSWFRRTGRVRRHRRYLGGRWRTRPWRRRRLPQSWGWLPSSGRCSCMSCRPWRARTASSSSDGRCRRGMIRYRPRWSRTANTNTTVSLTHLRPADLLNHQNET